MTYKQQQKQQQQSEPNNGAGTLYKVPNRKWEITGVCYKATDFTLLFSFKSNICISFSKMNFMQ